MNTAVLPFCRTSRTNSARRSRAVISSSEENGSSHSSSSRLDRERARDRDALAHAAGERMRIVVLVAGEPEPRQPAPRHLLRLLADRCRGFRRPSRTLSSAVRHGISRSFWNTMPILPRKNSKSRNGSWPITGDLAGGRLDQAGDQVEHGGLAAAGLAEHGDDLALARSRTTACRRRARSPRPSGRRNTLVTSRKRMSGSAMCFHSTHALSLSPARRPRGSAAPRPRSR